MQKVQSHIKYYQFSSFQRLAPGLKHLVTTRLAGYSQPPYDSLNVGLHVGDKPDDVIRNRKLVCRELGYGLDAIVTMQQSHTANVRIVDCNHKGRGGCKWEDGIEETDGMVTCEKDMILTAMAADCSVNLIYDPVKRVLAVAHSGWKGLASGVLRHTIYTMVNTFSCDRKHIQVGIGPTICAKCYEVGDNVIEAIEHAFPGRKDQVIAKTRKDTPSIDIVKALHLQLCDEGISKDYIEASHLCPACHVEEFYSYRAENKVTGRFGLFAVLSG